MCILGSKVHGRPDGATLVPLRHDHLQYQFVPASVADSRSSSSKSPPIRVKNLVKVLT